MNRGGAAKRQRELLVELLVVIAGVFIALLAQEAVAAWKWQNEVASARQAMRDELSRNVGVFQDRVGKSECTLARLDRIEEWVDSWDRGSPIARPEYFDGVPSFGIYDSVWTVINSGGVLGHFPLDEQMAYARLYAMIGNVKWLRERENAAWDVIRGYERINQLRADDIGMLRGAIANARRLDRIILLNGPGFIDEKSSQLRIEPEVIPDYGALREKLCEGAEVRL